MSGILVQKGTTPNEKPTVTSTPELAKINSSLKDFPSEIQGEIQTLSDTYSITPDYWGFDPVNNEIDLLAQDIPNTSAYRDLSGKKIGNFTIHIFNSTELRTTESEVQAYISPLMFTQDYQISNSMIGPDINGRPSLELECRGLTPENQKLDNKVIKGWRIHIWVCCGIPIITQAPQNLTTQIPKTNLTNNFS